jgi:RNA polymerase sigma factor for flagellar operon FliA
MADARHNKIGPFEEKLIENNLGLAYSIANRVFGSAVHVLELDEMRALALYGLVDAASRYEGYCERQGFDKNDWSKFFCAYANRRINGMIYDRLRSNDWATRSLREKSRKIRDAAPDDKSLTVSELAQLTGLTEKEVKDTIVGISRAPISLDLAVQGLANEAGDSPGLQVAQPEDTEGSASVNAMLETFADAVRELPIEQRLVVVLHYYSGVQLKKISSLLDVQDSQVSTWHTAGVNRLLEVLTVAAS